MKKAAYFLVFALISAGIAFTLYNNKAKSANNTIAADRVDNIPVTVAQASEKQVQHELSLVGTMLANSDVNIASEVQGRVTAVYAQPGDYKPAGAVIATVDDELKQAALMSAQANYDKAKADLDRFDALKKTNSIADAQYDGAVLAYKLTKAQLISAERLLRDTKITTLVPGIITARFIDAGANVNQGAPIANIVDISTLKIRVNLAERDITKLREGEKVDIETEVYPGVTFTGAVRSISVKGDDAHSYPVEITLPNSKANPLRAGMFARVKFTGLKAGNSVVIPRSALTGSVRDAQIFVVKNNVAELRAVTIGMESEEELEVVSGLAAGETVVTNGQNNLKNGVKVIVR